MEKICIYVESTIAELKFITLRLEIGCINLLPRNERIKQITFTKNINFLTFTLSSITQEQLLKVLQRHPNTFVDENGTIGHYTKPIVHRIKLLPNA